MRLEFSTIRETGTLSEAVDNCQKSMRLYMAHGWEQIGSIEIIDTTKPVEEEDDDGRVFGRVVIVTAIMMRVDSKND